MDEREKHQEPPVEDLDANEQDAEDVKGGQFYGTGVYKATGDEPQAGIQQAWPKKWTG